MCTVILLRRPDHDWPLLIAANRDERLSRPWSAPGRHWPDRPSVLAGYDRLMGGSWIGLNDAGVFAVVLNRRNTLGPAAGKRSRGALVLQALDHKNATQAADALGALDAEAYRPFNMIIADPETALWVVRRDDAEVMEGRGPAMIAAAPVPAGFSLIAADDLNDRRSPRLARLPAFGSAPVPDPRRPDSWRSWEPLLADRHHAAEEGPIGALCVVTDHDYGTVSSSLLALPAAGRPDLAPVWRFAAGRPGLAPFEPVSVERGAAAGGKRSQSTD